MISLSALPKTRIENLPIPKDIKPDDSWPPSLLEMADHIGPYAALQIADKFGGLDLYMPHESVRSPVMAIIGAAKAKTLCRIYERESFQVPVAAEALRRARRRDVLRALVNRTISLTEAAYIMRTSRRYVLKLVEEVGTLPATALS